MIRAREQCGSRAADDGRDALRVALNPAITRDGCQVEVCANIGQVGEAQGTLRYGANGVELLRTEFLYLYRASAPNEEEQVQACTTIARRCRICASLTGKRRTCLD